MADVVHKLAPIHFDGKRRNVVCDKSKEGTALVAIFNCISLILDAEGNPNATTVTRQDLSEELERTLREQLRSPSRKVNMLLKGKKKTVKRWATSAHAPIVLDPMASSCTEFTESDGLVLFGVLGIPILHGWVLDQRDNDLNFIQKVSRSSFAAKFAEAEQNNGGDPVMERLQEFGNASITSYGMNQMLGEIIEGDIAILYNKNQFHILHKRQGELFTLETSEEIKAKYPNAVWKKLFTEEDKSFHVTDKFIPMEGQPETQMKLAEEWYYPMKPKSLAETLEEKDSDVYSPNAAAESTSEEPTPPLTIGDRFFNFLSEFRDGSSGKETHFEDIAKEMTRSRSFKLYVPFAFIQKYDGNLAIDIQDDYPRIKRERELDMSLAAYIDNCGLKCGLENAEVATLAEVQIVNLPEPKSNQKFLKFVKENNLTATYMLYDGFDTTITPIGGALGLGYVNDIFDKFEDGRCWSNGWEADEMEVRNKGRDFVITKEADEYLTVELGRANLRCFIDHVFPHYEKGGRLPVFFDTFGTDIMYFPEPNKDSEEWQRFVKYMRSAFGLKAPLVRSTFMTEAYRVISLQLVLHPFGHQILRKRLDKDWRSEVKFMKPFSDVYYYKNNVSTSSKFYGDKWERSRWHVLKYSSNFIEHVLEHLMKMIWLHDISFAELMVARRLETNISDFVRTIVLQYGVDGLFSSTWGHFEASSCNKMPLQFLPDTGFPTETTAQEAESVKLMVHVSSIDLGDAPRLCSELSGPPPGSSLKMENLHLVDFKQFLESKSFDVKSSADSSIHGGYIIISKVINAGEHKFLVEGPWCEVYATICNHFQSWMGEQKLSVTK